MNSDVIAAVWDALGRRATRKTKTALADLRVWIKGRVDPVSMALTKDPDASWTDQDMEILFNALLDGFQVTSRRGKLIAGLFRTVISRWRELTGQDCPPPAPIFTRKRANHPRRYGLVRALRERNGCRDALGKAIRDIDKGKGENEPDWLALTVLSGLCQFQWLHTDTILAVINACANPAESFFLLNQNVAIWYGLPLNGQPDAERRVTILDALTAVLSLRTDPDDARKLLNCGGQGGVSPAKKRVAILDELTRRVNAVLHEAAPRIKTTTIAQVIRACSVAAYYWLPPIVVSYLKREYVSGSTSPRVLARMEPSIQLLMISEAIKPPPSAPDEVSIRSGGRESRAGHESGDEYMPKWSPVHIDAIAGKKRATIRKALALIQVDTSLPSIARLLAEFGAQLIANRGSKTIDPGSLRIYMRLLLRFLAPQFDDEDLIEMGTGELEEPYQEACNDFIDSPAGKAPSSRTRFIKLLLRWHNFLVDRHELDSLDDFSPFVASALPIDTNIISLDEYEKYLAAIVNSEGVSRMEKVAGVSVSNLGMAGARRSEAFYLLPLDVGSEYVLLRKNKFRSLKTPNSPRRIILALLLQKAADRLRTQARRRRAQGAATLLGSEPGGPVREEQLFEKLLEILRETCHDPSLRFHSLRHTAATLITVALLCEDTHRIEELLPSLSTAFDFLGQGGLREALYGTSKIHWPDLQVIVNMLGHGSGRRTSLPHYIHGMYLVHWAEVIRQKDLAPIGRELDLASGKHSSAYRKAEGPSSIEALLFRKRFAKQIAAVRVEQAARKHPSAPGENENRSESARGLDCARMLIAEGIPIAQIAQRLGMNAGLIEEVFAILSELAGGGQVGDGS